MEINNKGFTLIELLAVIAILGVLSLVGILSITKYISNSKKDAYVQQARDYIEQARNELTLGSYKVLKYFNKPANLNIENLKCQTPPKGKITIIPISAIGNQIEKKSSYNNSLKPYYPPKYYTAATQANLLGGHIERGFVYVYNTGTDYLYFIQMWDSKWYGIKYITQEEELSRKRIIRLTQSEMKDINGEIKKWEYFSYIYLGKETGNSAIQLVGINNKTYSGQPYEVCYSGYNYTGG